MHARNVRTPNTHLQQLLVVSKVDRGRLRLELGHKALGLLTALAESHKLRGSLLAKARGKDLAEINCSLRSHILYDGHEQSVGSAASSGHVRPAGTSSRPN